MNIGTGKQQFYISEDTDALTDRTRNGLGSDVCETAFNIIILSKAKLIYMGTSNYVEAWGFNFFISHLSYALGRGGKGSLVFPLEIK